MARTRSIEAHGKVIHAALTLFCERGIEAASMDAIARRSGVSKATIYNHWTDKEALLMEVMLHVNGADRRPGHVETGDLRLDLATVLDWQPPGDLEAARARITPMFMAYAAVHREFGAAWRHRVMEPGRNALQRILTHGIERGLLPPGLDLNLAIALLMGPMLYQHVFSKGAAAKLENIGDRVTEAFCRAHLIGNAAADTAAKGRKKTPRA